MDARLANLTGLAGIKIFSVEPGTVITDERTGKKEVVTDTSTVLLDGRSMYCTPATFARLLAAVPAQKPHP